MERRSELKRTGGPKPGKGFAASPAQKAKVKDALCIVSGLDRHETKIDPAHIIPRSMGGCDDALCVVPLNRSDHRLYDTGEFDLLPYLEAHHLYDELAHAIEHVGFLAALQRITNTEWRPA